MTGSNTSHSGSDADCKHVIIAGYGPVGRVVADELIAAHVRVTVVETNPMTIETVKQQGRAAVYGDVRDPEALKAAGVDSADALILAVPDEDVAVKACQVARQLNPDIFIAARTNFLSKGLLATAAGADHVVIEEVVTADAMQRAVFERLLSGVSAGTASG